MISNARENIRHLALNAVGMANAISGQQRQAKSPGNFNHCLVACLFIPMEMPL
jgi:hypothetical protein